MQSAVYQKLLDAIEDHVQGLDAFLSITEEKIGSILLQTLQTENFSAHKEVVRQVLFDYFASHGFRAYVLIKHDKEITYRLKINDYEGCIYKEACIQNLPKVDALIPNKDKPGISVLNEQLYANIQEFLSKYIQEEEDKKELFKAILKGYLNLSPKDVILFNKEGVLIKQFQKTESPIGTLSTTSKRSHDGLDKNFLQEIEAAAKKAHIDQKIIDLCKAVLKGPLNPSEIDNFVFAKNFVPVLQEKFLTLLPKDSRMNTPEIKQSVSNYLFRIYFDYCMEQIAREIIAKLVSKEPKIDAFIKFYSGDVSFTPDGKRFTRPDITDKEGNRWNGSTILQVAMQRKTGLDKIAKNAEAIKMTENAIAKFKRDIITNKELIERNSSIVLSLEADIQKKMDISSQAKENIFELKRKMLSAKGTASEKEIQSKINALSIQIKQLDRDEQFVHTEKKKVEADIEKAKARIITYEKDQASYEYKLEKDFAQKDQLAKNQIPLETRFDIVIEAFAKALSSFRGL